MQEKLNNKIEKPKSTLEKIKIDHPEIANFILDTYNPDSILNVNEKGEIETTEGSYLNIPRMQEMIRISTAINNKLPDVPENYIRLWRGNREGEVGKNPSYTNSLTGIALPFLMMYKGLLSYIDVPKEIAEKSLCTGAVAEGSEFILPKDILSQVKIVGLSENEKDILISKSTDLVEEKENGNEWWKSVKPF